MSTTRNPAVRGTVFVAGLILLAPAASRAADCPLPAVSHDPDGARVRLEVARATLRFAPAHPAPAGGGPVAPGSDPLVPHPWIRRVNFVDEEIFGAMDAAGVVPAPLSGDAEFLRRVTLDLTGRIPDWVTVKAFLADGSAGKRDREVDRLLSSDAFVDRWALFYDDLLRNTFNADSGKLGATSRNAFHSWFADAVRSGKPWDAMARELITAAGRNGPGTTGETHDAAANLVVRNLQTNGPPQDTYDNLAASTGSVFLGVNVFCTSCHSGAGHTDEINLWLTTVSRKDFWGMASFWSRTTVQRQGTPPSFTFLVGDRPGGTYQLGTTTGNKTPRDGGVWAGGATSVSPRFVLTGEVPGTGEGYRGTLARMVTSHPQFARAHVNLLWKELFGLGIVEPADDFDLLRQDPANPPPSPWTVQPTHPRLLEQLAAEYAAGGYDLRSILRTMVRSSAYQLSSSYPGTWSEAMTPLFARHFVRRLRAEEVLDAVTKATGVPAALSVSGSASPVRWAGQLPDVDGEPSGAGMRPYRLFLDTFLRGDRDTVKRSSQGSISQALAMLNDRVVTDRPKSSAGLVRKLLMAGTPPDEIVTTLFLATLSRPPSPSELESARAVLTDLGPGQTTASAAEDLQFVLLNKLDFLFCY
ncbi:DUF1553 domain-containing protein [Acidobacteria bacterium ACD]|nr:MAG: DUF1553 domain-containing protein [Acidobacteriota bacterium]MCE7958046.1 DUF1553 domain-containing protein [Acidobacteria bacterium ACB2]MDL1949570.1 DUF1553 domain-containing protein [Acidobacteria bacterium ACD]